jgi:hypothetical protein
MRTTITVALAAVSLLALAGCRQTTSASNEATTNAAAPTATAAAATIDGTWKADVDSVQFDQKPDEYLLQNGQYTCKSCVPSNTVAADGAFHPVKAPYSDELAVKVDDAHHVTRTAKKGGRQVGETKMTVSDDGNSLTQAFTDTSVANAPAAKGEFIETRVGPAPAGAHAISGQWKPTKLANFNAEALTFTFRREGDMLHMSNPTGQSYDAKTDGTDVPIKGDNAGTTASVKMTGDNSFQETDKRGGKVVGVFTFSVDASGKGHGTFENKEDGSKITYTATKQ